MGIQMGSQHYLYNTLDQASVRVLYNVLVSQQKGSAFVVSNFFVTWFIWHGQAKVYLKLENQTGHFAVFVLSIEFVFQIFLLLNWTLPFYTNVTWFLDLHDSWIS